MRAARWFFLLLGALLLLGCQSKPTEVAEEEEETETVDSAGNKSTAPGKVKILEDPAAENKRARTAIEKIKGRVGIDEKSEDKAVILVDLAPLADQTLATGLANLKGLKKLQELYLAYQPVTDEHLSALASLASLQKLSLYKTKITDAGLSHLAGLANLVELDLAFTKITDAGLGNLKGMAELKKLNLAFTEVTDAAVEQLKGLEKLEFISLGGTKVTDKGVEMLKAAFPKAVIQGGPPAAEAKAEQ